MALEALNNPAFQQSRPEAERQLSSEALLALDLQRAKEQSHMAEARDIVEAMSQLMSAHVSVSKGAPMMVLDQAKKDAAYLLARAMSR